LKEIKKVFSQSRFKDLKWFQVTGGEPFLDSNLVEVIRFFNNQFNRPVIWIPTNGIATKRIVSSVNSMENVNITVSIDGTRNTHNHIRGGLFFDKTLETIKRLRGIIHDNVNIGFTISDYNYREIGYVYSLAESLDLGFSCRPVNGSKIYYDTIKRNVFDKEKIEFLSTFFKKVDPKNRYYKLVLKYMTNSSSQVFPCTALSNSFHMSHDLHVFPCLFWNYDLGRADEDIDVLWLGKDKQEIRRRIKKGDCPNCCVECETCRNLTFYPLRRVK
jgi:MoaA/NifB/PqqE/SkfB family radical SAM enzyme